jgi:hypothetical protein
VAAAASLLLLERHAIQRVARGLLLLVFKLRLLCVRTGMRAVVHTGVFVAVLGLSLVL